MSQHLLYTIRTHLQSSDYRDWNQPQQAQMNVMYLSSAHLLPGFYYELQLWLGLGLNFAKFLKLEREKNEHYKTK